MYSASLAESATFHLSFFAGVLWLTAKQQEMSFRYELKLKYIFYDAILWLNSVWISLLCLVCILIVLICLFREKYILRIRECSGILFPESLLLQLIIHIRRLGDSLISNLHTRKE